MASEKLVAYRSSTRSRVSLVAVEEGYIPTGNTQPISQDDSVGNLCSVTVRKLIG